MLKEISETEFLTRANSYVREIEISDLLWILDDNLLDCVGIVVSFADAKILIECKETDEETYEFVYYEYAPSEREILPHKIISTDDEKIVFIRAEKEEGLCSRLRFHIGERPIMVTATDGQFLMVGLSYYDIDGMGIEFDNDILLNG